MSERILVTSALPYANGPLHIGHAIGAYVPADVYSRYKRMSGAEVLFVCATDEHGTPIVVAAEKEGVTPKQIVDKYHARIKEDFEQLGMSFDHFSRTTIQTHYQESQDFFRKVMNNSYVYKKAVERPYCPNCKRFLPDRFVKGTCPKCGAKDERGDQCEKCGKQLEPHELVMPYCAICKNTPTQKSTEHWFFKLSEVSEKLREWIEKNTHWPNNARNFALGWIKEGLEDRAITRDIEWGVPVPLSGAEGKVLYVWFDAPIGYVSITKEWAAEKKGKPDEWKKYWEEECKIVHFIGKDNIPFHTIIWPGMLIARGGYNLPYQVASNEFLTLQGQKMSTSRGWVVWLYEFLEKYPADTLRYSLLISNPEAHDADFSWQEYQSRVNGELADVLGNFVQRVLSFTTRYLEGTVPPQHVLAARDIQLLEDIKRTTDEMGEHLNNFKLQKALKELMGLAQKGNVYFNECAPWKGLKGGNLQETEKSINLCVNLVRSLAILSAPFIPSTAEKMWKTLNLEGSVHGQEWKSAKETGIHAGHKIREPEILFKKIEDNEIKAEIDKLNARLGGKSVEPKIKYEDFQKLDLRVGTVVSAERVPKSDKLLKLGISLGEIRTLVAGIGHKYAPEEMVGKQVIVVANLEPREFKKYNLVSEGMILAAEDGEELVVLTTDKKTRPGSKIG